MTREEINKLIEDVIRRHVHDGRLLPGPGWNSVAPADYVDEWKEIEVQEKERQKENMQSILTTALLALCFVPALVGIMDIIRHVCK